jgi:ABC-2 type transport system ATP-binding protein
VAEGAADELKRQVPGGHVRMRFADASGLKAAATAFATATRDDAALTLHVPTNGSVAELRALLDRLDVVRHDVAELTVHTPTRGN